ncbi:hypothetical protein T492DRAFT_364792 [Pavlovales sp. CCMP2436]|nr:hypothetical protein T492DRAFT_364792 [Pavlovales sp. CCMP2436]
MAAARAAAGLPTTAAPSAARASSVRTAATTPAAAGRGAGGEEAVLEIPDMRLAHAHFSHAGQRALNLADWFSDFRRRLGLLHSGAGVHHVLARAERVGVGRGRGRKTKRKTGDERRGDAKRRRVGLGEEPGSSAGKRARDRAVAAGEEEEEEVMTDSLTLPPETRPGVGDCRPRYQNVATVRAAHECTSFYFCTFCLAVAPDSAKSGFELVCCHELLHIRTHTTTMIVIRIIIIRILILILLIRMRTIIIMMVICFGFTAS